jgi:adenylyltransferase/sulfurtransferase
MSELLSDAELLRYSRQILLPEWDIDAQLKLKSARVLLIGMGGLGCPAAQALVRAGVGTLRLVDMDSVDDSNLQRQLLFLPEQIGQPKVLAAVDTLSKIGGWTLFEPQVCRVDADNLPALLANVDLVLDGSDNFATRDQVNAACVAAGVPLLSAAAIGLEGQMTLIVPNQTPCYRCLFPDAPEDARRCADTGVLATTTATMGAMQAHAALLYLGLGQTPLAGRLLLWDGVQLQSRQIRYQRDPECLVCRHTHA